MNEDEDFEMEEISPEEDTDVDLSVDVDEGEPDDSPPEASPEGSGGEEDIELEEPPTDLGSPEENPSVPMESSENPEPEEIVDDVNPDDSFGDTGEIDPKDFVNAIKALSEITNVIMDSEGIAQEGVDENKRRFVLDTVDDLIETVDDEGIEGSDEIIDDPALDEFAPPAPAPEGDLGMPPMGPTGGSEPMSEPMPDAGGMPPVDMGGDPAIPDEDDDIYPPMDMNQSVKVSILDNYQGYIPKYIGLENVSGGTALTSTFGFKSARVFSSVLKKDAVGSIYPGELLLSNTSDVAKAKLFSAFIPIKSVVDWARGSPEQNKAWRMAIKEYAAQMGHNPDTPRDWALVQSLAQDCFAKYFGSGSPVVSSFSNVKPSIVRKVFSALKVSAARGVSMSNLEAILSGQKVNSQAGVETKGVKAPFGDGKAQGDQVKSDAGGTSTCPIKAITEDPKDPKQQGTDGDKLETVQPTEKKPGDHTESASSKKVEGAPQSIPVKTSDSDGLIGHDGGDDVPMVGDSGESITEIHNAGDEFSGTGYSFQKGEIAALECPIENSNDSKLMKFKEVSQGVYVLADTYIRSNGGKRTTWLEGDLAKSYIAQAINDGVQKTMVRSSYNGKIFTLPNKKALCLKSSNVLGVIGVKGDFIRGLNNQSYDVFSLANGQLVNSSGKALQSVMSNRVIASSVGNLKLVKSNASRDLFAETEIAYTRFIKSSIVASAVKIKELEEEKAKIQSDAKAYIDKLKAFILSSKKAYQQKIAESVKSLEDLRIKSSAEVAQVVLQKNTETVKNYESQIKSSASANLNFMRSVMKGVTGSK